MERASKTGRLCFGIVALSLLLAVLCGCTLQSPVATDQTSAVKGIRLIAVLPVRGGAVDGKLIRLMREKVLENLYFRGYPKIPPAIVDERLSKAGQAENAASAELPPPDLHPSLGVDAVLSIDLREFKASAAYIYTSISVAADFELRSARTGETLWTNRYRDIIRNFAAGASGSEMAIRQALEPALQEVVDKALRTFPEGPGAVL